MDYFIGYNHAIRLIREVRSRPDLSLVPSMLDVVGSKPLGKRFSWRSFRVPGIQALSLFDEERTPHLLVPTPAQRVRARGVRSSVCSGSLPRGSFLQLRTSSLLRQSNQPEVELFNTEVELFNNYFVASPALCLVHAAQTCMNSMAQRDLTTEQLIVKLVALAMEFSGSYTQGTHASWPKNACFGVAELSTTSKMLNVLQNMSPRREGVGLAIKALCLAGSHAASPMETLYYAMLCLPNKLGGFGLPKAKLNHPVFLKRARSNDNRATRLRPDLSWEGHKVAIEYLGEEWHNNARGFMLDARRIQAYQASDWKVFPATIDDARTPQRFNAFASAVISALDADGMRGIWSKANSLMHDSEFLARQAQTLALLLPAVSRQCD